MIPKFDPKELNVIFETPPNPFFPVMKIYDYPVTPREAVAGALQGKAFWQVLASEWKLFTPRALPDNVARGFVFEAQPFDALSLAGGKDMFGVDWEFHASIRGSMVRPGNPILSDANEWRDKIVWPDIDKWDWEGSAKENNGTYLGADDFNHTWIMTGWFERLISFMDFEPAIMALFDEDQKDAVRELFEKLSDLYIKIFDKYLEYFPNVSGFCFHDDWGSQKETFFSPALAEEMIVPSMKRVTSYIHSKGKFTEFHTCGQLLKQVPNIIAGGWGAWMPQNMNDTAKIYELYGDKILLGTYPEMFDPATASEEVQRASARAYADKFCSPSKPSYLSVYASAMLTPAFREELYVRSRENYSK